jgi:hypothetical protein
MAHSTRKSRRQRNPKQEKNKEGGAFFGKTNDTAFFQPKLTVGQPGDVYEQEADAVAKRVVDGEKSNPVVAHQGKPALQKIALSTPQEDEKLGTAESRMERDKLIQEKPLLQAKEEEEPVQKMEEEEAVQTKEEEEPVQKMEEEEAVQAKEEEEPVQKMEEEEAVQAKEEEEPVQKMEEEEAVQAKEEEDPVQKMEEEEAVQAKEEEEPVQKMEEEEAVQAKKSSTSSTSPQINVAKMLKAKSGRGRKLAPSVRKEMEQAMGADFSQVNIHTDEEAIAMNKQLGAQAFTNGKDIYFNAGKYNPDQRKGKELLAHELAHVVQQKRAEVSKKEEEKTS